MKHKIVLILYLLALPAVAADSSGAVRKAAKEWADHWYAKHAAKVASLYSESAVVMPPNHDAVRGREAIQKFFQGALDSGITDIIHEIDEAKASGDRGYVAGRYSLSIPQKTGAARKDRGKFLQVWERQAGQWRIVAASFSSDLPAAPAAR